MQLDPLKLLVQGTVPQTYNKPQDPQSNNSANPEPNIFKSSPQNRAYFETQRMRSSNPADPHSFRRGSKMQELAHQPHLDIYVAQRFGKRLRRMYKFPASVNEALVHQRAHRNGYKSSRSYRQIDGSILEEQTLLCPCCQNFVNTVELPLCYSTFPKLQYSSDRKNPHIERVIEAKKIDRENVLQVFEMQTGNALFFCFIKLAITYLFLRFLILDVYNIYTNSFGHYCSSHSSEIDRVCINHQFSVLSTANKDTLQDQHYFQLYDILSLVFTLFSIVFFSYGRVKLQQLYELLQNWEITQDDYTILIEDIPRIPFERNDTMTKDINEHYKGFIQKLISGKIRNWLNRFYSYTSKEDTENHLEEQFYDIFKRQERNNLAGLFDEIVESVNLCYDLSELENLQSIRQKLVQEFMEDEGNKQALENSLFDEDVVGIDDEAFNGRVHHKSKGEQYISHIPHQIDIINRHYVRLCEKLSDESPAPATSTESKKLILEGGTSAVDNLKISRFVGKAFVSLKYQHYKHYLLGQYQENPDFLKINGNTVRLRLSNAQKPNDIYWNNMRIEDSFRNNQIRNSYFLVLVILFISFIILFKLRFLENAVTTTKTKKTIFESLYLISLPVCTFFIGYALDWSLVQLNNAQRHKTKTQQLSSLVIKNVGAKFMNTSVIYAFVYFFSDNRMGLLTENGLVSILMSLILINSLLNIGFQSVQPALMYSHFKNSKYLKVKKVNIFQIKLNRQLEYPAFDFAYAYSYYLQMIFIISFYGYLVPLGVPIVIIAFIFQYWIDKYNLLRRFSSPVDMGYFLTDLIWKGFEATLILRPIGSFVWGYKIHPNPSKLSIICNFVSLGLSLAYLILAIFYSKKLDELIQDFVGSVNLRKDSYQQAKQSFQKTFQSENPATSFLQKQQPKNKVNLADKVLFHIFKLGEESSRKDKFVGESEVVLENIWKDQEDRTIKYYLVDNKSMGLDKSQQFEQKNESVFKPSDFNTMFCW